MAVENIRPVPERAVRFFPRFLSDGFSFHAEQGSAGLFNHNFQPSRVCAQPIFMLVASQIIALRQHENAERRRLIFILTLHTTHAKTGNTAVNGGVFMRPLSLCVVNNWSRQLMAENTAAWQKRGCQTIAVIAFSIPWPALEMRN